MANSDDVQILNKWFQQDPSDPDVVTAEEIQFLAGVSKYESITSKFKARAEQKDVDWKDHGAASSSSKRKFTCSVKFAANILLQHNTAKSTLVNQRIMTHLFDLAKSASQSGPHSTDSHIEEGVRVDPPEPALSLAALDTYFQRQQEIFQSTIASALAAIAKPSTPLAIEQAPPSQQEDDIQEPQPKRRRAVDVGRAVEEFVTHLTDQRQYEIISLEARREHLIHEKSDHCHICKDWRTADSVIQTEWERFKNVGHPEYEVIADSKLWSKLKALGLPSEFRYSRVPLKDKWDHQIGIKFVKNTVDLNKYVWGVRQRPPLSDIYY